MGSVVCVALGSLATVYVPALVISHPHAVMAGGQGAVRAASAALAVSDAAKGGRQDARIRTEV